MFVKVNVLVNVGSRQIWVGDKVLGVCDEVIIRVTVATPEGVIALKKAPEIKLIKPGRAEEEGG